VKKHCLSAILLLLLNACGNLPVDTPPKGIDPPASNLAIGEAHKLKQKGNWHQAITLLEQASKKYPEDQVLRSELKRLEKAWELEERLLEDRILVAEMTATREKIKILEKLSQGEPDNFLYKTRLLFTRQHANSRADSLVACGRFHGEAHPRLAKLCLEQAMAIKPSEETGELLSGVNDRIRQNKRASVSRKANRDTQKRKREVTQLLADAEKAIDRGAYVDALSKLDKVIEEDPDNADAQRLLSETQTTLGKHVETLVRIGDQLYREEKIAPAVAIWEAALELDPDQQEVTEKIDRARRVLEKLEAIRSREQEG